MGGLGASRYLYQRLQARFGNVVVQPERAWSAVARGAVLKVLRAGGGSGGLERDRVAAADPRLAQLLLRLPEVDARIARLSYGVESGVPVARAFPPLDAAVDRTSLDPGGGKVVWRMKWYLRQVRVCLLPLLPPPPTRLPRPRLWFVLMSDGEV